MEQAILSNATLPTIERATVGGLISATKELALVRPDLDRMRLRFRSYDQPVKTLSGGNQQKVVLAKWLATKPRLLILDEPTQGVDVQTKAEVHNLIANLAGSGIAIMLISSELPELLGMSDRILVLREGRVMDEMERVAANPERVLKAATDAVKKVSSDCPTNILSPGGKLSQPEAPAIPQRSNLLISRIRHFIRK